MRGTFFMKRVTVPGGGGENIFHNRFQPSEVYEINKACRKLEEVAAKKRRGTRTDKATSGQVSTKFSKSRDKIAAGCGVSGRQLLQPLQR